MSLSITTSSGLILVAGRTFEIFIYNFLILQTSLVEFYPLCILYIAIYYLYYLRYKCNLLFIIFPEKNSLITGIHSVGHQQPFASSRVFFII